MNVGREKHGSYGSIVQRNERKYRAIVGNTQILEAAGLSPGGFRNENTSHPWETWTVGGGCCFDVGLFVNLDDENVNTTKSYSCRITPTITKVLQLYLFLLLHCVTLVNLYVLPSALPKFVLSACAQANPFLFLRLISPTFSYLFLGPPMDGSERGLGQSL